MSTPPRDPETGQFVSANSTAEPSMGGLRQAIAMWLGASNQGRNHYETFDWPRDPEADYFYATYRRNPFAKPIVDRPAFTAWRDPPHVVDDDSDEETAFEADMQQANRALDLWSHGERLDRLAGIGRYGLLVFVTSDVSSYDDLAEPLPDDIPGNGLDKVTQMRVFSEVSVGDIDWGTIDDAADGRWGKPIHYHVDFSSEGQQDDEDSDDHRVHHSRTVAAPASRLLDDDFFAPSRLETVINILHDIEKVLGSVAELAYRGADKGLAVNFDPTQVDTSGQSWDELEDELADWHQGLQPLLRTVGADNIQQLGGQIADASNIFEPQLDALSTATGIPKRVFKGDPAGALASAGEDTQAFFGLIQERREEYDTPHIARPITQWLIDAGAVAEPTSDYYGFEWDALRVLSEHEQAELGATRVEWLGPAIAVKEAREQMGLVPQPDWMDDQTANSYLSELNGGAPGGPDAGGALDAALAQNRDRAEAAARTEARIARGEAADD
jgi:hypothetical protein